MKWVKIFLEYAASQEEAIITFNASGIVLEIYSDASYLYEKNALSRAEVNHFLSSDEENPPNNGAILNLSRTTRNVMLSAVEAELVAFV